MRKSVVLTAVAAIPLAALLLLWPLAGIAPRQVAPALYLGAGLGAKLACSGRHLSGFDDARIAADLASYSALTRLLLIRTEADGDVRARLPLGPAAVARYRPGLGCALAYDNPSPLDAVQLPPPGRVGAAPWPAGSGSEPPDPDLQALAAEIVAADNAAGLDTRALLVARGGRLLAEAYGPGIDAGTPLLGWSMAKSVTAMLLGRLEGLGHLQVSERDLFPEWRGDERGQITVENLLQMTSGLAFVEDYIAGSDSTRMLFMSPAAAAVPRASPLQHAPGTHFSYSSGTTNLLALLAYQRVGGSARAQLDFFRRELAVPLALEATVFEPDHSGVFVGSSFLYASARDWARFGQLMLGGGAINGRRVLVEDWVRRATAPNGSANDPRYGYQFWLNRGAAQPNWPSLPADAYAMQGSRSQVVMVLPALDAVVVRLGWCAEYPLDANFARIANALAGR